MQNRKIKIALIDSGVFTNHKEFINQNIIGFSLYINQHGNVIRSDNFNDELGHGTAVFYLINNLTKNAEITNIKIYFNEVLISQEDFENILQYIYNNYHFDIVNISMGIVNCSSTLKMQNIFNQFHRKGTIIISAFDNDGAISFPAALDKVIGVDGDESLKTIYDYYINKNNIVNVFGKSTYQKVAWTNPEYNIVKGNSFTCCYITSIIYIILSDQGIDKYNELFVNKSKLTETTNFIKFKIKKAITFPFNKEIHSIANYEELLDFKITGYYTSRITGHVGKSINKVINHGNNTNIIKDIEQIEWDSFDTLILGHLDKLNILSKKNYTSQLIDNALKYNKNIYSFDSIDQFDNLNNKIYVPNIKNIKVINRNGKLFKTNIPILCVCGTNAKQGKFYLQLYFRKKLLQVGYKVGQIGTEPSSILFGMDEVFHCGYNQNINLSILDTYMLVNQMVWNVSNKNPDIILAGSQSGLLAYNDNNTNNLPTMHQIYFDALHPDAIVICINPFDDINFISRIIKTAEGLSGGRVIGLVCYPIDYSNNWKGDFGKQQRLNHEAELLLKYKCEKLLKLKLYMLDNENDLDNLLSKCLNYFSS